jgi:low affinity Fe/Cu permease
VKGSFDRLATKVADVTGRPIVFALALTAIVIWGICGPLFGFSGTWQLVINTGTTIITFLMIFLVQHTENKNDLALHLKLDALIDAIESADNSFQGLEDLTDAEVKRIKEERHGSSVQ